jgi:hypothetical protein
MHRTYSCCNVRERNRLLVLAEKRNRIFPIMTVGLVLLPMNHKQQHKNDGWVGGVPPRDNTRKKLDDSIQHNPLHRRGLQRQIRSGGGMHHRWSVGRVINKRERRYNCVKPPPLPTATPRLARFARWVTSEIDLVFFGWVSLLMLISGEPCRGETVDENNLDMMCI